MVLLYEKYYKYWRGGTEDKAREYTGKTISHKKKKVASLRVG